MSSVWTTSAYHSKHCTGRYQNRREDQVDQERTGGEWSAKTYERWGSPGRKQRWQLLTDTDGVGVWPNVSCCIRAESRSRSRSTKVTNALFNHRHKQHRSSIFIFIQRSVTTNMMSHAPAANLIASSGWCYSPHSAQRSPRLASNRLLRRRRR